MKFDFNNPYLSQLQRQQQALGLMPGSKNEIPRLGSLSSLNDSLNITTPGINFNAPGSMNSLNSSLSNFDPFADDVLSQNVGQSIASGNPLDPRSFIKTPGINNNLTPEIKPFDNYMNPQNANADANGNSSLSLLNDLTAPEVPEYTKFGNFLSRGMKGGVKTQEELANMDADQLENYDKARSDQKNMQLSNMLYNLGEYMKENGKPLSPNDIQQRQIRAEQLRVSAEAQERFDKAYANAPDTMKSEMDLLGRDAWNELQKERFKDKNTALMRNVDSLNKIESQLEIELGKPKDQQNSELIRQLQNNRTAYMVGIGGDEYDYELGVQESRIQARQKQDETFAVKDLEWQTNDRATSYNNIKNLQNAMNILRSGEKNVSGLDVAMLEEFPWLQAGMFGDAASFKSDVNDVVYQTLKIKLGAQFTENEGKRLVEAAFNNKLSEEENIARMQRLLDATMMVYDAKEGMSQYFNEFGTLDGYESNAPDIYEITAMVSGIPEDFKDWANNEEAVAEYAETLRGEDGKFDSDAKNKFLTLREYANKLERDKRAEEKRKNKGNK